MTGPDLTRLVRDDHELRPQRVGALAWWAALGLVVRLAAAALGSEAVPAAVLDLALLLPFLAVAQRILSDRAPAATTSPARTVPAVP